MHILGIIGTSCLLLGVIHDDNELLISGIINLVFALGWVGIDHFGKIHSRKMLDMQLTMATEEAIFMCRNHIVEEYIKKAQAFDEPKLRKKFKSYFYASAGSRNDSLINQHESLKEKFDRYLDMEFDDNIRTWYDLFAQDIRDRL